VRLAMQRLRAPQRPSARPPLGSRFVSAPWSADACAFIGPINWYGPTSNFKLLFDRLVCMNGGNPRPDLIEKKNTVLTQTLERSPEWAALSMNHLEGRSAAFFCYGDRGGADIDPDRRPKILVHKEWFDPRDEPYEDERNAYQSVVWQCRYSGIETPDSPWSHAHIGVGKLYANTQADSLESEPAALAAFDEWTRRFAQHVQGKGIVEGADDAVRSAKSTTSEHHRHTAGFRARQRWPDFGTSVKNRRFSAAEGGKTYGSLFEIRIQGCEGRYGAP
jgi:hypothetical protein